MRTSWLGKWWWVILFGFATLSLYFHHIQGKLDRLKELSVCLERMQVEKALALQQRETFKEQIASQNDPSWIELILMRSLGVVPEGWLKVHFIR